MTIDRIKSKVTLGMIIIFLVTASFAAAPSYALAAGSDEDLQNPENTPDVVANNALWGGLLGLGLLGVIFSRGDNNVEASPAKLPGNPAYASNQANTAQQSPPDISISGFTADEQRAFNLVNADRVANGLPRLKPNATSTVVARSHAQDEIARKFFAHDNPDGLSAFDRMRAAGISYKYAGENLAINRSVDAAEQAFMNSPGHRANILNPNYTELGIGVAYSASGAVYVVQNFIGR